MPLAKNVNEYIAKQQQAVAQNPECGNSRYNLAIGLLGLKRYAEAEKELLEAIECSPNLAEAYVQLGGIRLQEGDLDGCLDWNQRAVNARAGFSEGWGNIGFVYLQKGDVEKAIHALEKAIRWNPRFIQAMATLANAYLMSGEIDKSIEIGNKALDIDANFAVAHNNLAIAYLQDGHYEEAARHLEKAESLGYKVAPEIKKEIEAHR